MTVISSDWPVLQLYEPIRAALQSIMTATLRLLHVTSLISPISPLFQKNTRHKWLAI